MVCPYTPSSPPKWYALPKTITFLRRPLPIRNIVISGASRTSTASTSTSNRTAVSLTSGTAQAQRTDNCTAPTRCK